MKFLTDENIATSLVEKLRKEDHDVKDIKEEELFQIPDSKIIEIAKKEDRIILTHDKDFSNLLRSPNKKHSGVILLRFKNQSPQHVINKFIPLLKESLNKDLKNKVVIVEEGVVKIEQSV